MRPVKSPLGSLRAERAASTRRRILSGARSLFASQGYGATTLRGVADEAGVAVQTVYAVFESKANILAALRDEVRDDPAADRAFRAAIESRAIGDALDAFARSIRLRWEAGHDVVAANIDAASTDPSIRAEVETVLEVRRRGIARLAASIADHGAAGDASWTSAVLDALTMPELYDELTSVHGWTPDAYETWLAATLRATVAGEPHADGTVPQRGAGDAVRPAGQAPAATSDR